MPIILSKRERKCALWFLSIRCNSSCKIIYSRQSGVFFANCKLNHNFRLSVLQVPQRVVMYFVCHPSHLRPVIFSHLGRSRATSSFKSSRYHSFTKLSRCLIVLSLRTVRIALSPVRTSEFLFVPYSTCRKYCFPHT
jgi:hypothetical protein